MKTRKEKANALAELLMAHPKEDKAIDHLLADLQINDPISKQNDSSSKSFNKPFNDSKMIGIWEPKFRNGQKLYQRKREMQPSWSFWASIHEIPPKSIKKRVLLLGESVARGYFYDPLYSVAQELESVLNSSGEFNGIEVIDLAKTSMGIDELGLLVDACADLNPDAVVLFAGNNWIAKLAEELNEEDILKIKKVYSEDNFTGVKEFLENKFAEIIEEFFDKVKQLSRNERIPITVVIPGFNLLDWKSNEIERIFSQQSGRSLQDWVHLRSQAEQALLDKDYQTLGTTAEQMIALDASNPRGYELLATSFLEKGQIQQAIDCLDFSKDTTILSRSRKTKPRCFKVVREILEKEAREAGMEIVDLFSIFNNAFPKSISGKELYLDYCHLSVKGIKMAMRYTALALIKGLKQKTLDIDELVDSPERLSPSTEAMAHFCAAIHNAHYGQEEEILFYHCQRAVNLDPGIAEVIKQYIDFSTRKTSTILCNSFGEIIMDGAIRQYEGGFALLHPRGEKLMDIELINASIRALQSIGEDCEDIVRQLRIQEHGVNQQGVELLESPYQMTSYNTFSLGKENGFLQVRSPEKTFYFVSNAKEDLSFQLVYRNPNFKKEDQWIKIFVEDKSKLLTQIKACKDWTNHNFDLPASQLKKGVNQLIIEWPCDLVLNTNSQGMVDEFLENLFPVVGEIYSLVAKTKPIGY